MARQLTLLESPDSWRLDDAARASARRGLAQARAALAAHRPTDDDDRRHAAA